MILVGNDLYPSEGFDWLDKDEGEKRLFFPSVTLSKPENEKYYSECTEAEKEQWEHDHPQPEPQTEESVEQPTE